MKQLPLRNRRGQIVAHAIVDDSDFDAVAAFRWHRDDKGYARRYERLSDGRKAAVFLHRAVLGLSRGDGLEVDHVNRTPLDNRRANLRVATRQMQMLNRGSHRGSSSRYRGVTWQADKGKWRARVRYGSRSVPLGYFDSEEEAGRAAAAWRATHLPFITEPHPELLEAA